MKQIILVATLALGSTGAWCDEVKLLAEYQRHDIRVTAMCIEEHMLLVSHSDVGQGGDLQVIQLQHEVNGKIVPMLCNPTPQEIRLIAEYKRHDIRVTNMCIEEHIVVVTHSDVGMGGGLQMFQIQHEADGKIVPMKCDAKSQEAPSKK